MCPSQTHIETFSSTNKMLGLKVSFNKCKILESYQESSLNTMVYNQKSTTRERNDFLKKQHHHYTILLNKNNNKKWITVKIKLSKLAEKK